MTEKYTMNGWKFTEWLKGNKEGVKLTVVAILAYLSWGVSFIPNEELRALTVVLIGALTKLGLDSLDYWLKE